MNYQGWARCAALLMMWAALPLSAETPAEAPATAAVQASKAPQTPQLMLRSLEDRLGANPFDPVSLNNLAVIRLAEGDPLAAAELLARAHRLAPDNALVEQNHERLDQWLTQRREAGDPRLSEQTVADAMARPFPPEPPPIWPRP